MESIQKRRVTITDIARIAQVSKSTVSLVLGHGPSAFPISAATREKVLTTAREMGYKPNGAARALVTGRSNCILIVVFGGWDENLLARLRGLESYFVPHGYSIRLCTIIEELDLMGFHDIIQTGQADGVLLTGLYVNAKAHLLARIREATQAQGIPTIALADVFPEGSVDRVIEMDEEAGAEAAVAHLIAHGHRRIALISVVDQTWALKRECGYKQALAKAGLELDPALIAVGPLDQEWVYRFVGEMARTRAFTAIFVVLDFLALPALAALKTAGRRVPEDCALIGFDNTASFAGFIDPPLTTVANPIVEASQAAGELIIAMSKQAAVNSVPPLPTRLVIRRSCGCK